MEVSPRLHTDDHPSRGTMLNALDQAAWRAEQAAQRLKTSVTTPFTQLDFEAEYPGWSSSRNATSSATNSTPASVIEATTSSSVNVSPHANNLSVQSSSPYMQNTHSVSANSLYASQSPSESSVNPVQGVPRKNRTPRNRGSGDEVYSEIEENGQSRMRRPGEMSHTAIEVKGQTRQSRDLGTSPGYNGRHASQPSSMEDSILRDSKQLLSSSPRSSTRSRRSIHKDKLMDPSSPSETADPATLMQAHLRETASPVTSGHALAQISTGHSSTKHAQNDVQRLVYREVVDPVIQSMVSHHEGLCPELDGIAIRREVFVGTMKTILPNTLHDGLYPSKRRKKVIRRFAKELCSQKILKYTAALGKLSTSPSEHPGSRPRTKSTRTPSSSSFVQVLPRRTHQRTSITSSNLRIRSSSAEERSALSLESVGLSPPPRDRSNVTARSSAEVQHSRSVSLGSINVEDEIMNLHDSQGSHYISDEFASVSPSNQLAMHMHDAEIEEGLRRKHILPSQNKKGSQVMSSSGITDESSRGAASLQRNDDRMKKITSLNQVQSPFDESSRISSEALQSPAAQTQASDLSIEHESGQSVNKEPSMNGKLENLGSTKVSRCSTSLRAHQSAITHPFKINRVLDQRYKHRAQDADSAMAPSPRSSEIIVLSDEEDAVFPYQIPYSEKSNRHAATEETETTDYDAEIAAYLCQRTFGRTHDSFTTQRSLRYAIIDDLKPQKSWKGASGDIVSAAWNPNSQTYAIGATATANAEDLQYNRPNNLLYGDVNRNTLHELPNHRIDRPKPGAIVNGPNSHQAVYEACDPKVYKTVSAIQFSVGGTSLLTASHDTTVKLWDVKNDGLPFCVKTLHHGSNVSHLEVSPRLPRIFATGSQTTGDAIRIYSETSKKHEYVNLKSARAQVRPEHEIFPECLRWGNTSATEHLLLAGFARWGELPDDNPGREGELCIWDVKAGEQVRKTPSSQSVCTASFHPFLGVVATGGSPGTGLLSHRYTTKTVVRLWDMCVPDSGLKLELECPALDMQDLVFHPQNANILAVGCTDGAVYVWDIRNPEHILHKLQHGEPITDWDNKYNGLNREQGDAGVTMTLWGAGENHLYTGATDGMVKRWNVNYAPEDALVKDIAQLPAGVSCGSFSPDHVNLLVGDSTGGIHLLSSDPGFPSEEDYNLEVGKSSGARPIKFVSAPRNDPTPAESEPGQGQLASMELLESGQLEYIEEFGVIGQGPAYSGPYATYAHKDGNPQRGLLRMFEKQQPVRSKTGEPRDNAAARNIKATTARRREELNQASEPEIWSFGEVNKLNSVGVGSSKLSKKRKHSDLFQHSNTQSFKKLKIIDVVDLTSDAEEEDVVASNVMLKQEGLIEESASDAAVESVGDETDSEAVEDDYWFPYMDLEVFAKLNLGS